ncbi:MAG: biopolymer transporter ExbD [Ignavibacteriae bacterium]|nr:biopolymer transporter ExbD [Ignavibacteriota bacterium]
MAGGNFDAPETGKKGKKKTKGGGVHIDMTPMVDVIMLLLTFFMLTTTLAAPQLMKISLPKGDVKDKIKVDMGNVLFVRASEKGNVYFAMGKSDGSETPMEKIDTKNVATKLEALFAQNNNLLLLLKFDRKMKYHVMADIFDEISRAKIDKRYAFIKMEPADVEKINALGG